MLHTIVIAHTTEAAFSVMRYYVLSEITAKDYLQIRAAQNPTHKFANYEYVNAGRAPQSLEGLRTDRIVLVNYLAWGLFSRPGITTEIWDTIQRMRIMRSNIQLVWR